MNVAGQYREDKKSYVDTRDGEHFNLSVRTAVAPADRVPYRFDHVLVCLTIVGDIRFTTDTPGVATRHTSGNILLLPAANPLYTDYIESSARRPLECLTLELDPDMIGDGLRDIRLEWPDHERIDDLYSVDDVSEFVSTGAGVAIRRLHALLGGREQLVGRDRLIDATSQELIVLLLQSRARAALLSHQRGYGTRVARLVEYIRANLREDLSVARLAAVTHLSPSALHAHCRASFGIGPAALVRDCRIVYARELLGMSPPRAIKSIARAAGFSNAVQFTQAFRAVTGVTPSQYRSDRIGGTL